MAPIPLDRELLIHRLLGVIRSVTSSGGTGAVSIDGLDNCVTELGCGGGRSLFGASCGVTGGMFSCGMLTHETDRCQELDQSFPFLPVGWQADRIGDEFLLRPGHLYGTRLPAGYDVHG